MNELKFMKIEKIEDVITNINDGICLYDLSSNTYYKKNNGILCAYDMKDNTLIH